MKHIKIDGTFAPHELDGLIGQLQKISSTMSTADKTPPTRPTRKRAPRVSAARRSANGKA